MTFSYTKIRLSDEKDHMYPFRHTQLRIVYTVGLQTEDQIKDQIYMEIVWPVNYRVKRSYELLERPK